MTRKVFIDQLSELLSDLPDAEREEAIEYYNSYLDDAEINNDSEVLDSFGTPEQVAENIKAGLRDNGVSGETTENGFSDYSTKKLNEVANANSDNNSKKAEKEQMPTWAIVLITVGCVLFSPAILGIAGGVLGVILGVIGAMVGLLVALFAVVLSLVVIAVVCFVYALINIASIPFGAIGLIGLSLILLAVGLFFIWLLVMFCGVFVPFLYSKIVKLCKKIFKK